MICRHPGCPVRSGCLVFTELTPVGDPEKFGEKLIYMINNLSRYSETDSIPDNEEIMEKWYSLFD